MKMKLNLTRKQKEFIDAGESEVLFGGAAGGGHYHQPAQRPLLLHRKKAEEGTLNG